MVGQFRDVKPIFEIEVSVLIYPILLIGSWEPGFSCFVVHSSKGLANNVIRGGGSSDFLGESYVQRLYMVVLVLFLQKDYFPVIAGGIHFILPRLGIGWSHVDSLFYSPFDIQVLHEQLPASLLMSEVLGLFEVSQVLVVGDDSHWVLSSCEIVSPFFECLDDCQEFPIIDVVVSLGRGEGGRMVGTRVKVSIGVLLHEYPSGSCE